LPDKWLSMSRFHVQIKHRIGALKIDVDFELTQPWTLLFGPSGSGKTTILRAIAGLLRPDRGRIVCTTATRTTSAQNVTLFDSASNVFLPAHERRIAMAAQQPNLFPHMTALENILYGARPNYSSLSDFAQTGKDALLDFGLMHVSGSLPRHLSGGEAQRVNLVRAMAANASRLLLLDEPFTGMDTGRRDQLLPLLREKLAKSCVPVLSVTHDVAEAFQLGAEVIKIAEGKVVKQGPVEVVLAEEREQLLRQLSGSRS
jgi:molybdate transport system ATP-binding protein